MALRLSLQKNYWGRTSLGAESDRAGKHQHVPSDSQHGSTCEGCGLMPVNFPKRAGAPVFFLFNPFPESVLIQVSERIEASLASAPKSIYILYLTTPCLSTCL